MTMSVSTAGMTIKPIGHHRRWRTSSKSPAIANGMMASQARPKPPGRTL